MTDYCLLIGVYGHATLCVPVEIFNERFVNDGGRASHWHALCTDTNDFQEEFDNLMEEYRLDGGLNVKFGSLTDDVNIVGIYDWDQYSTSENFFQTKNDG